MTIKIGVIIPTRNRAQLAMAAARSLLNQSGGIEIFLSDNSSSGEELREFCTHEKRVHYLRPPRELSMPEHWDWAIRQALDSSVCTHFHIHYDRKISKARHWDAVVAEVAKRPHLLMTMPLDFVAAVPMPRRLWQPPWTGKVYEIETRTLANLVSAGRIRDTAQTLPILSNCVVPRSVFEEIGARFGNICNSTGPDSCFTARFLAMYERYLHFDWPIGILQAQDRSNGMGYLRGKGGDFNDFMKTFGERPWLDAAPIPGINLGQNMLYHEYELVRRQVGSALPPLDREGYLNDLARELHWVAHRRERMRLRKILEDHGWRGKPSPPLAPSISLRIREKIARLRLDLLGRAPLTISGFSFKDDEEALRYAVKYPRPRWESSAHLAAVKPVEVHPQ